MVHFDVFDTHPLNGMILGETASRFSFIHRKFCDEDAKQYARYNQRILFLSDIRPPVVEAGGSSEAPQEVETFQVLSFSRR